MDPYLTKFNPRERIEVAGGISLSSWLPEGLLEKLDMSILSIYFSEETPYHYHKKTQEVFRFHNPGKVIFEGEEFKVEKDSILYVPVKAKHKLIPLLPNLKATLITIPKFDPYDEHIVD